MDWGAVAATDFRARQVKEGKQAEFLVYDFFPWELIRRIGVRTRATQARVETASSTAAHRPAVAILPDWYYG